MTTPQSDEELGRLFRAKAESLGCSPAVLMRLAEAIATFQSWSVMPNLPPRPNIDVEEILGPEHLAAWPEWTAKLISPGCRVQRMVWPDGTITTRLMSRQWAVLAAEIERPSAANKSP